MSYQRGDIVFVPFPFADLKTTKNHPAVVISSDVYHRSQPDIVIVAVTSQTTPQGPTDTLLKDWQSAGLLKPSLVKAAFATIEPSLVRFRIGKISPTDQKQLDRRIRIALNL